MSAHSFFLRKCRKGCMPFSRYSTVLCLLFSALFLYTSVYGIEIRLKTPHRFYFEDDYIYVDAEGSASIISEDILAILKNNIPITVTYYLRLYERNFFVFSLPRQDVQIINRIRFDIWSGSYFVEKAGELWPYSDIPALEEAILNLRHVRLAHVSKIDPEKKYFVKSRVTIKVKNPSQYYFYYLINNLLSIFQYRSSYNTSKDYSGACLLQLESDNNCL